MKNIIINIRTAVAALLLAMLAIPASAQEYVNTLTLIEQEVKQVAVPVLPAFEYNPEPKCVSDEVFMSAATMPEFHGGEKALIKYINKHIKYPRYAQDNNIQGKVVVQFVVEKDGSIGEVKIARSVDKDLDAEAKRVCKSLPKFRPGKNANGDSVRVWYTIPITFKLQADDDLYESAPEPYNEIYW
ncbi:MAG: energy transducer TonB [Muribaculaceae bacterium]|nr:energy transducer TonB [Muribaculaceae bacterium]